MSLPVVGGDAANKGYVDDKVAAAVATGDAAVLAVANAAKTAADTAISKANAAQGTADTARSEAQAAQATAEQTLNNATGSILNPGDYLPEGGRWWVWGKRLAFAYDAEGNWFVNAWGLMGIIYNGGTLLPIGRMGSIKWGTNDEGEEGYEGEIVAFKVV
jgi:hypothetical protein